PARAPAADRRRVLQVPDARREAELLERQRSDRAQIDDVPRVGVVEALSGEDPDLAALAALEEPQLPGLRDLVAEPEAGAALDAAVLIEHDVRPDVDRLRERELGLGVAALAVAVRDRVFLEAALAGLIADRAVERVVDEEELHHRRPRLDDLLARRVHDHPLGDGRVAADDELRRLLDLDEAHAAVAGDREAGVVAVVWDLAAALLAGVQDRRPGGDLDLLAVDRDLRHLADSL